MRNQNQIKSQLPPKKDPIPNMFFIMNVMLISGIAFVVMLSFINYSTNSISAGSLFYAIGNGLLIAGAFYGSGGFIGFLFGIPKVVQNNNQSVSHNDNLVQVSDWLTKIIVGVGLTQLYNIPGFLLRVGRQFGKSVLGYDPKDDLGTNVAIAIILYFSILGFLMVYLWTRIYLINRLRNIETYYLNLLNKIEGKLQSTESEKENLETQNDDLNALVQTNPHIKENIKQTLQTKREDDDDPNKGNFGGLAESNGRKITASVRPTSYDEDLFSVLLQVVSTSTDNPLVSDVVFHLHPTFSNAAQTVKPIDGKAELRVIAWGAFTVGAVCDGGTVNLELDLSELPDAPKDFKER
jgi:hypothetical protein